MKPKHIVNIGISLDVGGISKLILGMISSSALSDCKQSVICLLGARGDLLNEYRASGASLYTSRIRWPDRVRFLPLGFQEWIRDQAEITFPRRLAWLLRRIKADVVHIHSPRKIDLIAHSCFDLCNIPLVWSIHGENLSFDGPKTDALKTATAKFVSSGYGRITADSTILAQGFLKHFPEADKIVQVVHAGADTAQFQKNNSRDPDWRRKFGIPENALVFGSCGRLARVKGFDIFVQAASLFVRRGVDVHFVISGKGNMYESLSSQIAELNLSERFHLVGFQEDLPRLHKELDVFVLSSRSEGFPLALIEALASGLPCIATDVSGVREMFGEYGGIVVEPESPIALAEAMAFMLDPDMRRKFSASAPSIGQKYSYESCSSEFLKLYSLSMQAKKG